MPSRPKDSRTGRIEGLAEVAERDLGENRLVVVLVESRPAPVSRLHCHDPLPGPLYRGVQPVPPGAAGPQTGQHDERHARVVHVRVPGVGALERPAARRHRGHLYLPVPRRISLLLEDPLHSALHGGGRVVVHLAILHRHERQQRVPYRRLAGVDVDAAVLLIGPVGIQGLEAFGNDGVGQGIALGLQRQQAVDPGRLDAGPGTVGFLAAHDPLRAMPDRDGPPGVETDVVVQVQAAVGDAEQPFPGDLAAALGQRIIKLLPPLGKQLIQAALGGQAPHGPPGGEDGQRHHGAARPAIGANL